MGLKFSRVIGKDGIRKCKDDWGEQNASLGLDVKFTERHIAAIIKKHVSFINKLLEDGEGE